MTTPVSTRVGPHPHAQGRDAAVRSTLGNPHLMWELLRERLGIDRQRTFFFRALEYQHRMTFSDGATRGAYYEFGVGWGDTLTKYLRALDSFCRAFQLPRQEFKTYGFDTFSGLPPTSHPSDRHPMWNIGDFACDRAGIQKKLRSRGLPFEPPLVDLIEGPFEATLTRSLREAMKAFPPSIVTVDVDYYTSTKTVLDWIRPILPNGAILYFDDIWAFHGDPALGELAAIREFNQGAPGRLSEFPLLGMPSLVYIYSGQQTP